jgi:triphosphatase
MPINPSNDSISKTHSPSLEAGSSVPEAVYQICSVEIKKFEEMLPVAIAGRDIEGVHKVRVALRRMRTCLKFGKPYYQKIAIAKQLNDLKRFAQLFGSIRDLDVLKENFSTFHSQLKQRENFDILIWNPLFANLYSEKYAQLVKVINTNSIENLGHDLLLTLDGNILLRQELPSDYPDTTGQYLASNLNNKLSVIKSVKFFGDQHDNLYQLHRLRLKAKSFRYLLEFFDSILDAEATKRLIQTMILFQDHLGEINDTVVAMDLIKAATETKLPNSSLKAVNDYQGFLESEQSRLIHYFEQIWQEFIQTQPAHILEDALAPLAHS